jgi:hypothetical protein
MLHAVYAGRCRVIGEGYKNHPPDSSIDERQAAKNILLFQVGIRE